VHARFAAVIVVLGGAAAAAPVSIVAPGFHGVDVTDSRLRFYAELVAQAMAGGELEVVTQDDLSAVLGLERQKQLLGCADEGTQCLAELGAALGADGILRGEVARVGAAWHGSLKVLSAKDGRSLAARQVTAAGEEQLAAAMREAAVELALDVLEALGRGSVRAELAQRERRATVRKVAWVPLGLGAASLLAGAISLGVAEGHWSRLSTSPRLADSDAVALASGGSSLQATGVACLAAGVALLTVSLVLLILGREPAP